jgi:hypothetical protein
MKTLRPIQGLAILITLLAMNSLAPNVSAQDCKIAVKNVYFVDSGQTVEEVHPGSNGGNGYQLNILGTGVDNLELVQERFMTSVSVIPNYTSATAAKWQVFFAANMGRMIPTVRLKDKCTGKTIPYRLDTKIQLLDK